MKKIISAIVLAFIFSQMDAQSVGNLQFKNGKFKIMQITDAHVNNNGDKKNITVETIRTVIAQEKPDFIVITGDMIVSKPAKNALLTLTKPVVEAGVPWSVAFGNHDEEQDMSKTDMWKLFQSLPNFVGEPGSVSGVGNNAFPVYASSDKNKVASVIYMFDSHDYPKDKTLGTYDWIKFDQVQWYRAQSDKFTALNNGNPLPGVAYFHIPLVEFKEIAAKEKELIGEKHEDVCSADINSGLFASFVDKKDVMGVFVGHDHDNNYAGIHKNIALGFGQVTGADAYGNLERGCRIVELAEGDFSFTSWIRTPTTVKHLFHYPSGLGEPEKKSAVALPVENK